MNTLKESIKNCNDIVVEPVVIPEWKDENGKPITVYVRTLTGPERDEFEKSLQRVYKRMVNGKVRTESKFDPSNIRVKLAMVATCNGPNDHSRFFSESDEEWLKGKSAAAVDRIFDVAQRLSGLTDNDIDELMGN